MILLKFGFHKMKCDYEITGSHDSQNILRCRRCEHQTTSAYGPELTHTMCRAEETRTGPLLHRLLQDKLGAGFKSGCDCKEWLAKMNAWGPAGCREHLTEIVDTLMAEATRRDWKLEGRPLLSKAACVGTKYSLGKAFAQRWARKLVLKAIERSEQLVHKGEGHASPRRQ